ncbi:MAG: M3 family oligoendopeptidase [Phycisphaerae bacterium]
MANDEFPFHFAPSAMDASDWGQIEAQFKRLDTRELPDSAGVEQWLRDWSELESIVGEEEQVRYVEMTRQTDDSARERRYLDFVEQVTPSLKRWQDRLDRKLLQAGGGDALPSHYDVLMRQVRNRIDLFRDENVALQTEDEKLRTQYQKICGAMTVQFDGRDQTLQQMSRYLEEPDRSQREAAWRGVAQRRLADRDVMDAVFDEMAGLRHRIAVQADQPDYRAYAFRLLERFDYSPRDCEQFHEAVASAVVPFMRSLQEQRRRAMGLTVLRPWDMAVDPMGRPPLRPFNSEDELTAGCEAVIERLSPELAAQYQRMRREDLLDLGSRKGKAPGGYMTVFERRRLPFIFMNAVGRHDDVHTLLHEAGHAFHAFATRDEPLISYRNAPIEFAEVASMGMELLCEPHLDVFYESDELARARREDLEDIVRILCWIATIDAFQHWIYLHPNHTCNERTAAWLDVHERFGGIEDWSGLAPSRAALWHRQLHPFTVPFYYVEYGIAQLGALQLWLNAKSDRKKAISDYRTGLGLGGSRPLPALFRAAGLKFDFSVDLIQRLMSAISRELKND